jgi:hypothetical protein
METTMPTKIDSLTTTIELLSTVDLVLLQKGVIQAEQIHRCTVLAQVNRHATMLTIPDFIQEQLQLKTVRTVSATDDGCDRLYDVTEPVEVRFENRRTLVEALVRPDTTEAVLGLIPIQGLDVVIDYHRKLLIANPASPNCPKVLL